MAETRKVVGIVTSEVRNYGETLIAACDDGACFRLLREWKRKDNDAGYDEVDRWCPMLPVPGTLAAATPLSEGQRDA